MRRVRTKNVCGVGIIRGKRVVDDGYGGIRGGGVVGWSGRGRDGDCGGGVYEHDDGQHRFVHNRTLAQTAARRPVSVAARYKIK